MEAIRPLSHDYLKYSCIFPPCQPSFLTFFLERKKAKNFYVAGRRLARLYFAGYGEFVSAVLGSVGAFGSGSPTAGLFLPEKGKELLRRGTELDAPLPCGIRQVCVRVFRQCRGFWLGLSSRWLVLERKKAENFYVAGRRLARLYFAEYGGFVSAGSGSAGAFGSDSPYCWPVLAGKTKKSAAGHLLSFSHGLASRGSCLLPGDMFPGILRETSKRSDCHGHCIARGHRRG